MTAFLVITFCAVAVIAAIGYKLKINSTRKQKEETTMDDLIKNKGILEEKLGTTEKTYSAGNSEMKRKLDALENDLAFWRGQDKEVPIIVNDEC